MKTAILSVIFPTVMKYFDEFLDSLIAQTDQDFELVLMNDSAEVDGKKMQRLPFPVHLIDVKGTPPQIRKAGIQFIQDNGFDYLIFADSDDIMSPNRVEFTKTKLGEHSLFFNELKIFTNKIENAQPVLSKRFKEGDLLKGNALEDFNCMGLTNTAAHVSILKLAYSVPNEHMAIDWSLFAGLIETGNDALYSEKCFTYYRQYNENIASLIKLEEADILRGVSFKAQHYTYMATLKPHYEEKANKFRKLHQRLQNDMEFRKFYCTKIKKLSTSNQLWWEAIVYLSDEHGV